MKSLFRPLLFALAGLAPLQGNAAVKLPGIFGNNMVLQRDAPIWVWGWAAAGERVTVSFNSRTVAVTADKNGRWTTKFPSMEAGGPFEMIVTGTNQIKLSNVLIGDVWICSGQSNMQWTVKQTDYVEKDSGFIARAPVRLFTVHIDMDYLPKDDLQGTGWKTLSEQAIEQFSAVAYHFGKYINQNLNVPIGLVSDNLGATAIETWMSNEALLQFLQFKEIIGPITNRAKNFTQLSADFEKIKSSWFKDHYYKGKGIEEQWFKPETDISDWKPIKPSGNTWEEESDLRNHDGEVWFRTSFDLPENYSLESYPLHLLQIDDYDITWVNGVKVGETYGNHNHRSYHIPTTLLKPKNNVLVIRVFDAGGIGGFTTSSFWGNPVLWGDWHYKKGQSIDSQKFPKPITPNATPFSSPGVLYNAIIAPLTSFRIKGVIWYQGESNVDRADEYRALFPAMIKDWRKQWKQGDFPFLFVQLANHYEELSEPGESNWAELREAQAMALALPNTGMAAAIDIGEANDIHPKNKIDVGKRLALAALATAYQKNIISSGPTFKEMILKDHQIIVEYNNVGNGLFTTDKYGYVRGFQVAGADKKFYWAQAFLQDNKIVATSKQVQRPVAIRYAWENNPGLLNLYNKEGLPALPFRTDSWPGITMGVVFKEGPRF